MTFFWIGVVVMTLLAFGLLWPAWRRAPAMASGLAVAPSANLAILKEQLTAIDAELAEGKLDAAQHQLARTELERRLLDEESGSATAPPSSNAATARRLGAWWLAPLIPMAALGLYVVLGNLPALGPQPAADAAPEVTMEAVAGMVDKLAKRLESQPPGQAADLEGWTMLARSYAVLQRFPEAARAYAKASALAPQDAQLLADQADALAMTQNQSAAGEPTRLIEQALKLDPNNLKALALAGSAAFERKDFGGAVAYWTKARQGADGEFANGLDRSIVDARAAAGMPGGGSQAVAAGAASGAAPASSATTTATAAGGEKGVGGRVTLAPALAANVAPTDTLFVFARAEQGPRMPLAILKRSVADLPFSFTLDDSLAMSPALKLSSVARVVVSARISRTGNAMPQAGDLVADDVTVDVGASGIQLVIDRTR